MTYARRKDANHNEIAEVFKSLDCSVIDLSGSTCGFDILAGYKTQAIAIEIKDGAKPPSARKLTLNENNAHNAWRGPKAIILTNEDAIKIAKLLRQRHFAVLEGEIADRLGS